MKKKSKGTSSESPEPVLTKHESYVIQLVKRTDLKKAPYNPRILDPDAKKRLAANLKKRGLMEPPIVNSKTMNVIGGNQRLGILDDLNGGRNYMLHVAMVSLDENDEKAQNIHLNNPAAQADYDMEALEKLFKEGVSFEDASFTSADIHEMFGDSLLVNQPTEDLVAMANRIREAQEMMDHVAATETDRDDQDYYSVFVHKNDQARVNFTHFARLPDSRFTDGRTVHAKMTEMAELLSKAATTITVTLPRGKGGQHEELVKQINDWLTDNINTAPPPTVTYGVKGDRDAEGKLVEGEAPKPEKPKKKKKGGKDEVQT